MGADRNLKITCIPGDGIGPEIVAQAKKIVKSWRFCAERCNFAHIEKANATEV